MKGCNPLMTVITARFAPFSLTFRSVKNKNYSKEIYDKHFYIRLIMCITQFRSFSFLKECFMYRENVNFLFNIIPQQSEI